MVLSGDDKIKAKETIQDRMVIVKALLGSWSKHYVGRGQGNMEVGVMLIMVDRVRHCIVVAKTAINNMQEVSI